MPFYGDTVILYSVSRPKSAAKALKKTSISLDPESIQILRLAAAVFNLSYLEYIRKVAIAHAKMTLESTIPTMEVSGLDKRKVIFDDESEY